MATASRPDGDVGGSNSGGGVVSPWSLVATLGEDVFASTLLAFLQELCAVEHLVIYSLTDRACALVAAAGPDGGGIARCRAQAYLTGQFWRRDPVLAAVTGPCACDEVATISTPIATMPDLVLRDRIYRPFGVRARMLIAGEAAGTRVALSLIRTDAGARYAACDLEKLRARSGDLVALVAKHILLSGQRQASAPLLTSLVGIERRLKQTRPALPRREAQVCARILYGMTSAGISLDLSIGEESAMTYRKRAYARLGIASQRELLLWYLGQGSGTVANGNCPAAGGDLNPASRDAAAPGRSARSRFRATTPLSPAVVNAQA